MSVTLSKIRRFLGFTSAQSDALATFEANAARAIEALDAAKAERLREVQVNAGSVLVQPWTYALVMSAAADVVLPTPSEHNYGSTIVVAVAVTGGRVRALQSTINNVASMSLGAPGLIWCLSTRKGWFFDV